MAKKNNIKFNKAGFQALREDPKVEADLVARGEAIAEAAGGKDMGYLVKANRARDVRSGVTVMATGHAARSNRKHQSLIKALPAGK